MKTELEQFKEERNAALLSMDEATIRQHHARWSNLPLPKDPLAFWGSVHKTVTAIPTLPLEMRRQSKVWLDKHGLKSWDDGEL